VITTKEEGFQPDVIPRPRSNKISDKCGKQKEGKMMPYKEVIVGEGKGIQVPLLYGG
jgi:hypothetical protein